MQTADIPDQKSIKPLGGHIIALTQDSGFSQDLTNALDQSCSLRVRTEAFSGALDFFSRFLDAKGHSVVVILDAEGDSSSVISVIRILRSMRERCPILLLLPSDQIDVCSEAVQMGRVLFLVKPVTARDSARIVCQELCGESHDQ